MKVIDFSIYILTYNFIIGVLLMIGSEKLGAFAGWMIKPWKEEISRLARIGTFTFGVCVAALSLGIYLAGHVLEL